MRRVMVNAERTSRGLAALERDADLGEAARGHAGDMVRRDYFAHVSPAGDSVGDRTREAGYDGRRVGENLGWGVAPQASPAARVDAWLASPSHRRILFREMYVELGVGVAIGAPDRDGSVPGATYALNLGTG